MSEHTDAATRQATRVASRRRLILDAAADEFAEAGYERATLDRIGERVGLSKASLYYYVQGKEDLLAQLVERVVADIEARAAARTPDGADPVTRLRAFVHAHLDAATSTPEGRLLAENLEALRSDAVVALSQRHEATLAAILRDGITAGQFRDAPTAAAVKLIFGALNSVPVWYHAGGGLSLDDVAEIAVRLVLSGVQA